MIKKNRNKKVIGMIHGVFDVLHVGHIKYFEKAQSNCDFLIASVTHDKFVKNKSPNKPIFNISERISVMKSLKFFNKVIISNNETAIKNIKNYKPDLYFKGMDYKISKDISGNLKKEINELKKYGGKIFYTNTKLYSSSKIINNKFNYIDPEIRKYLKSKNLDLLKKKLSNMKSINKKVLIFGEPIIDKYEYVRPSGKSNKASIISTIKLFSKSYAGGIFLVSNILSDFFKKINLLYFHNQNNLNILNTFLNYNIKRTPINSDLKIIKKIRFIDNYTSTRLFQTTENETLLLESNSKIKLKEYFIKNLLKFDYLFIFDFGYNHICEELLPIFKKNKKKLIINCQSNSYNFGFNRADKYLNSEILGLDEPEFRLLLNNKTEKINNLIIKNKIKFKNIGTLIVTSGKNGCHILTKGKYYFIPTIMKDLKDTTGCGDIFLTIFAILKITKIFNVEETAIISHIAAGIHGSNMGNTNNINFKQLLQVTKNILNV